MHISQSSTSSKLIYWTDRINIKRSQERNSIKYTKFSISFRTSYLWPFVYKISENSLNGGPFCVCVVRTMKHDHRYCFFTHCGQHSFQACSHIGLYFSNAIRQWTFVIFSCQKKFLNGSALIIVRKQQDLYEWSS